MLFLAVVLVVGILSGMTASIAGFGIGSMLTPLLALRYGTAAAIAAVALPHAVATGVRFWLLRKDVDWSVARSFGVLSAIGGLAGALLYTRLGGRALTVTLALLLLLTSLAGITGWTERWRPRGATLWVLGLLSGAFGGVAGNQGSLRSAALLAFELSPRAFVATATVTALMVDAVRTPVYLWRAPGVIEQLAAPLVAATIGVLAGTVAGERLLLGLPRSRFRRAVAALIGALGVWLLWSAFRQT